MRIVTDYKHAQQIIAEQDKRIAELEAALKSADVIVDNHVTENERLRAVIDAIKHYCYSGGTRVITVQRIIEQDLAAVQEGEGE